MGFGVWGLGSGVWGFGFRVSGAMNLGCAKRHPGITRDPVGRSHRRKDARIAFRHPLDIPNQTVYYSSSRQRLNGSFRRHSSPRSVSSEGFNDDGIDSGYLHSEPRHGFDGRSVADSSSTPGLGDSTRPQQLSSQGERREAVDQLWACSDSCRARRRTFRPRPLRPSSAH